MRTLVPAALVRGHPLGVTHHGVQLYMEAGGDRPPSGVLYVPSVRHASSSRTRGT